MKPIDFRNETFSSLTDRIAGQRAAVLGAWRTHGPGTTAEVANRAALSVLSFRPRTTELFDLGFICLADKQTSPGEGVYRARTHAEWLAWSERQIAAACSPQRELNLK